MLIDTNPPLEVDSLRVSFPVSQGLSCKVPHPKHL